jgi:L-amino acid N-acyltransferase YncA
MPVTTRLATDADWQQIWPFWHAIVGQGRTYTWDPQTTKHEARAVWMVPRPAEVWVAEDADDVVVGSAVLEPNQPGLGSHVAHAAFMVDPARAGQGIGRMLALAVLDRARAVGYTAMQFNAVVADNPALALWRSLGFEQVGRVPDGFRRPDGTTIDLLVLHRAL